MNTLDWWDGTVTGLLEGRPVDKAKQAKLREWHWREAQRINADSIPTHTRKNHDKEVW